MTLVGKGVVFDTGGLDIKPPSGMELMKKDMGGAATALTLARLIMEAGLDVRLRVLSRSSRTRSPARRCGRATSSRAARASRVEIGNTDAEGRLILADALALAAEEAPDLLLDFATLTGAARVALGPDLPPFYTDDEALAADIALLRRGRAIPLWRLPLWRPYDSMLDSQIADLNNAPGQPVRRLDHRGAVPQAVRRGRQGLGAFRRLRLEPEAARARAAGRRNPGRARASRAARRPLPRRLNKENLANAAIDPWRIHLGGYKSRFDHAGWAPEAARGP